MSGASHILSLRSSGGSIAYSFRTELVGEGGVKEDVESCPSVIDRPFEVAWAVDMRSRMVWMD